MNDTARRSTHLRIRTLGALVVEAEGVVVSGLLAQRKSLALLAMLAVAGERGISRDKALAMLWPESPDHLARNALCQLLFRIRRELGGHAVLSTGDLRLNDALVSSDITDLETAFATGHLAAVAELCDGPFLDGFFVRDAPEFEHWVAEERARTEDRFFTALETMARDAAAIGDHVGAVRWWGRRMAADPLNGRTARMYLEALVAAGDRESAVRLARAHRSLVRAELDAEPDDAFAAAAARLTT